MTLYLNIHTYAMQENTIKQLLCTELLQQTNYLYIIQVINLHNEKRVIGKIICIEV